MAAPSYFATPPSDWKELPGTGRTSTNRSIRAASSDSPPGRIHRTCTAIQDSAKLIGRLIRDRDTALDRLVLAQNSKAI